MIEDKFHRKVNNMVDRLTIMLLDYKFHTVLKYKIITHISLTSLAITSHRDPIRKHVRSSNRRTF